jgi:tetratricopeptide (TPR) repeat protein
MDPEVLQIAKDAQVGVTVSDVKTLEAFVPLNKAKLAYQAGQFQESIAQARNTLALLPNLPTALWAIGISYGRLGQWDMAVSHLQAALKADKSYADAKDGLKWAKNGQKAAMDRKTSTIQAPRWN